MSQLVDLHPINLELLLERNQLKELLQRETMKSVRANIDVEVCKNTLSTNFNKFTEMEQQFKQMKQKLKRVMLENQELNSSISQLRTELDSIKQANCDQNEVNSKLQIELSKSESKCLQLESKLKKESEINNQLQDEVSLLQDNSVGCELVLCCSFLRIAINERNNAIEKHNSQNNDFKIELNEVSPTICKFCNCFYNVKSYNIHHNACLSVAYSTF